MQKILVWDLPVRLGHWLMVGGFCLAWLTGDSETFRLVHVIAGATVLGVATFRLPWGFIGSRYARFVRKHREVPARLWHDPRVKSAANCEACHRGAVDGNYSEHDIAIRELKR